MQVTALGKQSSVVNDLKAILDDTGQAIKNLAPAAAPFIEALIRIGRIGLDALVPLTGNLTDAATRMRDFVTSAAGTQKIKDWVSGGVDKFKDLGEAVGYIFDKLDDLWQIAKPIFTALEPIIQPVVDVLIRVAQAVGKTLTPAIETAAPFVEQFVSQLGDAFVQALQDLAPMLPGLVTALGKILQAITPLITQVGLPLLIELVRTFITALIEITPAALIFIAALTPIIGLVAGFIALLTGNAPAAFTIVQNSFTSSAQIMKTATDTNWGGILQTVNSSLDTMQTAVSNGSANIADTLTQSGATARINFGAQLGSMVDATHIQVGAMAGAAVGGVPGMANAGNSLGSAMSGAIRGLDWEGIGSDIARGVIHGVLSFPGTLIHQAAVSFANKISSAFRSALAIGSPSKVMAEEVGRWIPAGIGKGIMEYSPSATAPAAQLTRDVEYTARGQLATAQPAPAAAATVSVPLVLDLGEGIKQRVQIEIDRNNRATARALSMGTVGR